MEQIHYICYYIFYLFPKYRSNDQISSSKIHMRQGTNVMFGWNNNSKVTIKTWFRLIYIKLQQNTTGPWFNIKMPSYRYRKSHCGDKTVVRSSYLHNGISYTVKMTFLYWIRAQSAKYVLDSCTLSINWIANFKYEDGDHTDKNSMSLVSDGYSIIFPLDVFHS